MNDIDGMDRNLTESIYRSILDWMIAVRKYASGIRERGRRPVVIALSRRMPVLVDWILNDFAAEYEIFSGQGLTSDQSDALETLRGLREEMMTELSFVFRYCNNAAPGAVWNESEGLEGHEDEEYLIVDDAVFTGRSANQTILMVEQLTRQEPYLAVPFVSNGNSLNPAVQNALDVVMQPTFSAGEMQSVIRWLSDRLASRRLDMFMEFPVFSVMTDGDRKEGGLSLFEDAYGRWTSLESDSYCPYKLSQNRASMLLKEETLGGFNNDFAKVRMFGGDGLHFVVFAPNEIATDALVDLEKSDRLFVNPCYRELWNLVTEKVRACYDRLRVLHPVAAFVLQGTLCVYANWLMSLSCMVRHIDRIVPPDMMGNLCLVPNILEYMVGKESVSPVMHKVDGIIAGGEVSPSLRPALSAAPMGAPDHLEREYDEARSYMAMYEEDKVALLNGVFRFQWEHISLLPQPRPLIFGETFGSMMSMLTEYGRNRMDSRDAVMLINRYVDCAVDMMSIVPRYYRVRFPKGTTYLKRYFQATVAWRDVQPDI